MLEAAATYARQMGVCISTTIIVVRINADTNIPCIGSWDIILLSVIF